MEDAKKVLTANGGQITYDPAGMTTFILTTSTNDVKSQATPRHIGYLGTNPIGTRTIPNLFQEYGSDKVILKHEWVVQCMREGRLMTEKDNWGGWRIRCTFDDPEFLSFDEIIRIDSLPVADPTTVSNHDMVDFRNTQIPPFPSHPAVPISSYEFPLNSKPRSVSLASTVHIAPAPIPARYNGNFIPDVPPVSTAPDLTAFAPCHNREDPYAGNNGIPSLAELFSHAPLLRLAPRQSPDHQTLSDQPLDDYSNLTHPGNSFPVSGENHQGNLDTTPLYFSPRSRANRPRPGSTTPALAKWMSQLPRAFDPQVAPSSIRQLFLGQPTQPEEISNPSQSEPQYSLPPSHPDGPPVINVPAQSSALQNHAASDAQSSNQPPAQQWRHSGFTTVSDRIPPLFVREMGLPSQPQFPILTAPCGSSSLVSLLPSASGPSLYQSSLSALTPPFHPSNQSSSTSLQTGIISSMDSSQELQPYSSIISVEDKKPMPLYTHCWMIMARTHFRHPEWSVDQVWDHLTSEYQGRTRWRWKEIWMKDKSAIIGILDEMKQAENGGAQSSVDGNNQVTHSNQS
ncbi:uncharacterized protein IL334_006929 [Kwoniella shivajii]|uniref:BRCT domain-containing protein n=1 Tax=Kwoniella shivajii TaxID=564305 RepID=A0ABZ1D7B7_9TREE|nr:hypothetical protein IL334_006929 [Kwoniella shivajii]